MWFKEKALVFVDTRSAALAIYQQTFRGSRLRRFASERFESRASQAALFSDVLLDSRDAVARLSRDLRAPCGGGTILLPIGATFPSIVDASLPRAAGSGDVDQADVIRFRLAPLLPFPVAEAEIRVETSGAREGAVLAQAILRNVISESERLMSSLGFARARVTSALSAALRGLSPRGRVADLIFGDSACAMAVRDSQGAIEAIHLRFLLEGDDRAGRSIDEALRANPHLKEIRVLGEPLTSWRRGADDVAVSPAFEEPMASGAPHPQQFPFLSIFHGRASR